MVGYVICGVLVIAVLALAVILLLQRRRLRNLAEAMEDYLTGNQSALSISLREDAVAPVENAAAEMKNRIDVAREQYHQETRRTSDLTADISHQLKTPLASLRLFCEMDASPHLPQQISQIERMETLIGSLLRLEKLCADGYEFVFAEQPLRSLVEEAWRPLHALWPGKQIILGGDAVLLCDRKWLTEALHNLLKNACEHTPEDGLITVQIEQAEYACYCTVEDNGGGVSPDDLPHLFERFYRAGSSKTGTGLGLAIVREIVYRHHGHITAENTPTGLKFSMEIPILHLTKS